MTNEEINEIILEPDPARVMEGLRDTGYDFNTAIADLVDNSIAANASKIKIKVNMDPKGEITVYIADNGHGMDMLGLKNAMKYGSQRREDPSSLGKFGLGLKTASTAFCRSLSVLSKTNSSEYNKVRWDIDEICKINKWKLLQPQILQDEIDILEEVSCGKAGTLVIWEKVDRLMKTYAREKAKASAFQNIINKLRQHLAMVFQRFLDKNFNGTNHVDILVNDEVIMPWDPFCTSEPYSKSLAKSNIEVELPSGKKTHFFIEAWLLPRVEEFSSSKAKNEAKISNDMEGFYVYRENRLIYFGDWLGMFVNDPHISLLRVNFSFDHTLDDAFNVDIKKSRIMLAEDIFDFLKNSFMPAPRREAENVYRKGQNAKVKQAAGGAHDASNANIEEKANSLQAAQVDVIDANKGTVKVTNTQGSFTGTIRVQAVAKDGQTRVIPVESIESGMLWEPTIVAGKHAVSINQSHPYYSKVYAPVLDNHVLVTGMDSLLWALSEAEMGTYNEETKEQYEDMRIQVSRILKKLVNDLPDPDIDENQINN